MFAVSKYYTILKPLKNNWNVSSRQKTKLAAVGGVQRLTKCGVCVLLRRQLLQNYDKSNRINSSIGFDGTLMVYISILL